MSGEPGKHLPQNILAPITILMLLVLSVAIVGMLIFAKPVIMFLDGQKKEAVSLTIFTISWLAAFTVIFLIIVNYLSVKNF